MNDFSLPLLTYRFDLLSWLWYCLACMRIYVGHYMGLLQNGREVLVCALTNGIGNIVVNNDDTQRRFGILHTDLPCTSL